MTFRRFLRSLGFTWITVNPLSGLMLNHNCGPMLQSRFRHFIENLLIHCICSYATWLEYVEEVLLDLLLLKHCLNDPPHSASSSVNGCSHSGIEWSILLFEVSNQRQLQERPLEHKFLTCNMWLSLP